MLGYVLNANPEKKMATVNQSAPNITLKKRARLFFLIVPTIFLADYFTKHLVKRAMVPYEETIPVIDGLVKLRFIYNEGIAFGINLVFIPGWLLILISCSIAILIIVYIFFSHYGDLVGLVALCLIAGGAIGNLFDRIAYGRVIDFIEIGINDLTWPVFNVADISVTCGAILLALHLFFHKPGAAGLESSKTSGQPSPTKRS